MSSEHARRGVSVILTVLDEADNLRALLESLAAQTLLPDEVVVVDGGSTDGTLAVLENMMQDGRLRLHVLQRPGANISRGRNIAIDAAAGPIIASTDAGVRLDRDWLERLVAPLANGMARVASGFFASDPQSAFETALGAATLPEAREIDGARFLPSSRSVAFLKEDWTRAGGYPEWLDYCEDLVFDLRLLSVAGPAVFVPDAVAHFRPRTGLRSYYRQYFRYARGDGKADLWRRRHTVRYATYLIVGPALAALGLWVHPLWWGLLLAGGVAYLYTPFRRLWHQGHSLNAGARLRAWLWVPVIRVVGDVAKMLGYPAGWRWRLRERPPRWRPAPLAGRSAGR
jgi:glycosyltransferase involved in cell wall biosynthesis